MAAIFSGPEEEFQALRWMKNKLSDVRTSIANSRKVDKKQQLDSLNDLFDEIKSRESELKIDVNSDEDEFHDRLWDRFIFACTGKWMDDQDGTWSAPYEFGEWEFQQSQQLKIGHSKF